MAKKNNKLIWIVGVLILFIIAYKAGYSGEFGAITTFEKTGDWDCEAAIPKPKTNYTMLFILVGGLLVVGFMFRKIFLKMIK